MQGRLWLVQEAVAWGEVWSQSGWGFPVVQSCPPTHPKLQTGDPQNPPEVPSATQDRPLCGELLGSISQTTSAEEMGSPTPQHGKRSGVVALVLRMKERAEGPEQLTIAIVQKVSDKASAAG